MNGEEGKENDELEPIKDPEEIKELEPKGKKKAIWDLLLDGISEEDLSKEPYNYNKKTVGVVAWELDKAGLRKRPARKRKGKPGDPAKGEGEGNGVGVSLTTTPPGALKVASPEALVDSLEIPTDGQLVPLADGIKVGMSLVVLGVRVAQELSYVGVQQARPLVAMAREMRAGEETAARMASKETAFEMANRMQDFLTPALNELGEMVAQQGGKPAVDTGPNPMQGMMTRIMEPVLSNLIGSMFPGAATTQNAPTGWKRVQRTSMKEEQADDARPGKDGPSTEGH